MDWRQLAACRGLAPTLFEPSKYGSSQAVAVCGACPVQPECLEWALVEERYSHMIIAGMTQAERERVRRDRRQLVST